MKSTSRKAYRIILAFQLILPACLFSATIPLSNGNSLICQRLEGVYADTYDIYEISFDIGYRCDQTRGGHINAFRVSLWDSVSKSEITGENIIISQPWINTNQSSNVATLVSRRMIFEVDQKNQPHHPLPIRFRNHHIESNPVTATAVLDNVSIQGLTHAPSENKNLETERSIPACELPYASLIHPGQWSDLPGTFEICAADIRINK